jgi:hypothetical protein
MWLAAGVIYGAFQTGGFRRFDLDAPSDSAEP